MADTWRTRTLTTFHRDGEYLTTNGLFGILNTTSNKIVNVKNLTVQSASGIAGFENLAALNVGVGRYRVFGVSDVTGGSEVSVTKYDSASSNLPSQVIVRSKPDITTSREFRFKGDLPGVADATSAGAPFIMAMPGKRDVGPAELFEVNQGTGVERIVLQEGQGFAIVEANEQTLPHLQSAQIVFRVASTGATYSVFLEDMSTREAGAKAALAIFNGSGSGIVLEVARVLLFAVGNSFTGGLAGLSAFRLHYFNRYSSSGNSLTANTNDSANSSLPAGIDIRKNFQSFSLSNFRFSAETFQWELASGEFNSANNSVAVNASLYNRLCRIGHIRAFIRDPYCEVQPFRAQFQVGAPVLTYGQSQSIRLRQNEGLALSYGWPADDQATVTQTAQAYENHTYNNLDVGCEFTVEDIPPSGSGAASILGGQSLTGGLSG